MDMTTLKEANKIAERLEGLNRQMQSMRAGECSSITLNAQEGGKSITVIREPQILDYCLDALLETLSAEALTLETKLVKMGVNVTE